MEIRGYSKVSNFNIQLIMGDLIHNFEIYRNLVEPLKEQLKTLLEKEDSLLHDEIKKQYKEMVKSIFLEEITKRLQVTTEEAMGVIEDLNIEEYLK